MNLSISTAWDETAAFARRAARLWFPIAFVLLSLPAAIVRAIAPAAGPGGLPRAGLWLLGVPVLFVASLVGALAISHLALHPGASGGGALRAGRKRFVPLLCAALLVGLGGALLTLPLLLFISGMAAYAGDSPIVAWLGLLALIWLLIVLFFWVRLMLLTPAASAEPIGSIALILRSWDLTRGHFWRLLGFVLTVTIVSLVVLAAIGAIGGILVTLAAGRSEPGNGAMLLILLGSALLQALISGLFTIFVARIYAQLAEPHPTKGS
jgi:hypothetical protein